VPNIISYFLIIGEQETGIDKSEYQFSTFGRYGQGLRADSKIGDMDGINIYAIS
jgi:hypothetical protein